MEKLVRKFLAKYNHTDISNVRLFINDIDWRNRFIGIKGSRGVGKTTLLLQYIKLNFDAHREALYISLDDLYFSENNLYDLAEEFHTKGGKFLAIDEVHRYPHWATELKNIYDDMPDLRIAFTGSSLLHLHRAKSDLSRRTVMYEMPGLSFREFLKFETSKDFPILSIDEIVNNHTEHTLKVLDHIKPLAYFSNYLDYGYYPFYLENKDAVHSKLNEVLLTVLEIDIPQFETVNISNIIYLKRLLKIISKSVPFKPNMKSLSEHTGITLNTMKTYLRYLANAELISLLYVHGKSMNSLDKPEKIFLENSNLMYSLAEENPNIGNIRETFFFNQVSKSYTVNASKQTDFLVEEKYSFEVGGKNKNKKQIAGLEHSFIAKDDIEIGYKDVIPLWLFGFLY